MRSCPLFPIAIGLSGFVSSCLPAPPVPDLDAALPSVAEQRVRAGDDLGWASPRLDDADWERAAVPGRWTDAPGLGGRYWVRVRFHTPPAATGQALAIVPGGLADPHEVYVNGTLVAQRGWHAGGVLPIAPGPFAHRLGVGLLAPPGGHNVLALRMERVPFAAAGVLWWPPLVGSWPALEAETHRWAREVGRIDGITLGALAVAWALLAFLGMRGVRAARWLFATVTLYGAVSYVFSFSTLAAPAFDRTAAQLGGLALLGLPLTFVGFGVRLTRRRWGWVELSLASLVLATIPVVAVATPGSSLAAGAFTVWVVGAAAVVVWLNAAIWGAQRRGVEDAGLVLLGTAALGVMTLVWLVEPGALVVVVGTMEPGILAFIAVATFTYARRAVLNEAALRRASDRILDAHERERARLARDLHDGLGQDVAAVKLAVERAAARAKDPELLEAAAHVAGVAREIRAVAHNLRSARVVERGLADALRWHAAELAGRTGVEVHVDVEDALSIGATTATALYRIAQEAIANSLRHGRPEQVLVELFSDDVSVRLTISDDGSGFAQTPQDAGIGLSTIRERAALLGGGARITSTPRVGTVVAVWVPSGVRRDEE